MKIPEKLKSRKFLAALAGAAVGIAMAFGADESEINAIMGAVTSVISLVAYIFVEGKIDAAAIGGTAKETEKSAGETDGND